MPKEFSPEELGISQRQFTPEELGVKPAKKQSSRGFDPLAMIMNAPESLYKNTIGGLYEAVTSPIQTATGVLDVAAGGLQNMLPASVRAYIDRYDPNPEASARARAAASAVGQEYASTYGTPSGFAQTMESDPFRVLGDVSMLAGGGSAAARLARLPQTSQALARTSQITNPVNALIGATRAVAPAVTQAPAAVIGLATGAGPETVKTAFRSGQTGNQAFLENMRGNAPITDVLDDARSNLQTIKQNSQAQYRSGMSSISKDKTVLDFTNIDDSISKASDIGTFKGQAINQKAADALQEIKAVVDEWKKLDPVEFHTPEGLDALKQKIGSIQETIPFEQRTAQKVAGNIYNSVKNEIVNQAPEYAKVMKSYEEASLALGASHWQTLARVKIPAAISGIIAACMLGMGRAIGETMTVLMATGCAIALPGSFLDSVQTMTSTIAIELGEVPYNTTHYYALFAIGLTLFVITFVVNMLSDIILHKYPRVII